MRDVAIESQYSMTLDQLRMLAQRELLDWWVGTDDMPFFERREFLPQYFADIVETYGAQAAEAAADYLFLQRSLDEDLAGLAFPDIADPVTYAQAEAAFKSVMRADEVTYAAMLNGDPKAFARAEATSLKKLQGTLNRLVLEPSRATVEKASRGSGSVFARLPEPQACTWCLMLATRGAVYRSQSVAGGQYHDNCRCLAIEVKNFADLPQINKDLEDVWVALGNTKDDVENERSGRYGDSVSYQDFDAALKARQSGRDDWMKFADPDYRDEQKKKD